MKKIKLLVLLLVSAMFVDLCSQTVIQAAQTKAPKSVTAKKTVKKATEETYKAMWFSYYDYSDYRDQGKKVNASTFQSYMTGVVKKAKNVGMNRIIVQVRPFGDAMYSSKYFPWSKYISGKQGRNPGFDPLKIMVSVAHKNGMKIEAWVNPYRVTLGSTNINGLSANNPARKWYSQKSTKRNVLVYNGSIYYNPSKKQVRNLIVNGAKEIVKKYDVDGIHMDDYFYPSFTSSNVKTAFDAPEYNKSSYKKQGKSIAAYRREQVNLLVRQMKKEIQKVKPEVTYGISPAGNIDNLTSNYSYYVDINKWLNSKDYVDYIAPQVYWGFHHPTAAFDKVTDRWVKAAKSKKVKLYLGIGVYRVGYNVGQNSAEKSEWRSDRNILKKQVQYGLKKSVDGFAFFDYQDFNRSGSKKAVVQLKTVLK